MSGHLPVVTDGDKLLFRYAQSFGFSHIANPHNTELPWYGIWNHYLQFLVQDIPVLFVAPQYALRFYKDEDEDPDQPETNASGPHYLNFEDVLHTRDIVEVDITGHDNYHSAAAPAHTVDDVVPSLDPTTPEVLSVTPDTDDEEEYYANTSIASKATTSSKGTSARITDFAIILVVVQEAFEDNVLYGGWRIRHFFVPIIVELKRFPSRSLSFKALSKALSSRLNEARADAITQAIHLFQGHPGQDLVVIIVGSGPVWSHTALNRASAHASAEYMEVTENNYRSGKVPLGQILRWSTPIRLDTKPSDDRLETIRQHVVDLAAEHNPSITPPVVAPVVAPAPAAPIVAPVIPAPAAPVVSPVIVPAPAPALIVAPVAAPAPAPAPAVAPLAAIASAAVSQLIAAFILGVILTTLVFGRVHLSVTVVIN